MLPDPNAIRAALREHSPQSLPPLPGRTNHLAAGVLVPLRWARDDVEVILTERALDLSNHPGEICFPGGRPEEGDEDVCATALREAREEIGLEHADVLGKLSSIPLYTSDHRLHPFVAQVPSDARLRIQPEEVASIVVLRVRALLDSQSMHGIPWEQEGMTHVSPIFETDTKVVFGGTAHALWELLGVVAPLFDRTLPALITGKYTWADVLPRR